MRRKIKKSIKKTIYHSEILEKLINKVMWDGKRSLAARICNTALEKAARNLKCTPQEALQKAADNVMPLLEVKSRRVGGATYQVPVEVTQERAAQLAIRWLVEYARARKGKSMAESLGGEIIQAAKGAGEAVKKREDTHRMAEANKAFAHYRW